MASRSTSGPISSDGQALALAAAPKSKVPAATPSLANRKLSYNEKRELEALPGRIELLETEERALHERIAAPGFYKEAASAIRDALDRVDRLRAERDALYARWDELDGRAR